MYLGQSCHFLFYKTKKVVFPAECPFSLPTLRDITVMIKRYGETQQFYFLHIVVKGACHPGDCQWQLFLVLTFFPFRQKRNTPSLQKTRITSGLTFAYKKMAFKKGLYKRNKKGIHSCILAEHTLSEKCSAYSVCLQ